MKMEKSGYTLKGIKSFKSLYTLCLIFTLISETLPFDLTLLHTNDVHARFEQTNKYSAACSDRDAAEDKCYGGVARRYFSVKAIRRTLENVILLDAGDQFQGTLWFTEYKGLATSYFMNLLEYDAMALGNHEFDNGAEGLKPFLNNATFPVLSCNINASADPYINGLFMPSKVLEVGGEQIGIVGYTTDETVFLVEKEGIKNLVFEDEITAIKREVKKLQDHGINKIIVLGHGGYLLDLRIAEEIDGVDIVVGGHSNTFLFNGDVFPSNEDAVGPYPTVVEKENGTQVLVVQAYAFGKYLGFLQTTFDDNGTITEWSGAPILLDSSVEQHPDVVPLIEEWAEPLEAIRQEVLGTSYVFLDGPAACRLGECNLGNLICDALLEEHITGPSKPGDPWTDISLVMLNGGGFRTTTDQGPVTMEHVLQTLPFRNTVVMVRITGEIILQALEHSASIYNILDPRGAFLQLSGIRVVYRMTNDIGNRVVSLSVRCQNCTVPTYQPLELDLEYNVLINSFMVAGGDGYSMIRDNVIDMRDFGNLMSDSLASYIYRHSPIYKGLEGRIYVLHDDDVNPMETSTVTTRPSTKEDQGVSDSISVATSRTDVPVATENSTDDGATPPVNSAQRLFMYYITIFICSCLYCVLS